MDKYTKSAIIGYFRMGATDYEIALLVDISTWEVIEVVKEYIKIAIVSSFNQAIQKWQRH